MEAQTKTVLAIDDDPYILDMVGRYLKAKGYRFLATTDPEKAYQLAEQEKPALIISDIAMPGLDGLTLLKGLKQNKMTQDIPVVFLTGTDKLEDVETGFSAGAKVFILKPLDWSIAWPKIQPFLEGN